jgi:two-component system, chemotaxis family, protein-glutamate methylesterase/glutaminase
MSAVQTAASQFDAEPVIRVMVVDDSVVVRGLVSRWLEARPGVKVVASLRTGREAVEQVERADPDVVVLDIEMPEMDGLTALPLMLAKKRDLVVIMASTLTRRHAEVSLKALSLGATDYVPKPESNRGVSTSPEFQRELVEKVRQLGARRARRARRAAAPERLAPVPAAPASPERAPRIPAPTAIDPPPVAPSFKLRTGPVKAPRALLIGASTGGPQALMNVVGQLAPVVDRVPIMIVQHMPATFTTILAEHLARGLARPVREPQDGEPVTPGVVHLAPGGRHMLVALEDGRPVVRLSDGPAVNFCRPAVDPLFQSGAQVWKGALLGLILTGMGHDGTAGARAIVDAGGAVIAQDEATSVVWGMPGSAAQAGVCAAVLPLDQIGSKLVRVFTGGVA